MRRPLLMLCGLCAFAAADTFVNEGLARIQQARLTLESQDIEGEESIKSSLATARENLEQIGAQLADTARLATLVQTRKLYENQVRNLQSGNDELESRADAKVEGRELIELEREQIRIDLNELEVEQGVDRSALDRLLEEEREDLSDVADPAFDLLNKTNAARFSLYTYDRLLTVRENLLRRRLELRGQVLSFALQVSVQLERRAQIFDDIASFNQAKRLGIADRLRIDQDSLHTLQLRRAHVAADSLELLLIWIEEMDFRVETFKLGSDEFTKGKELRALWRKIASDSARLAELEQRTARELLPVPPGRVPDESVDVLLARVRAQEHQIDTQAADYAREAEEARRDLDLADNALQLWNERLAKVTDGESSGRADEIGLEKINRLRKTIRDRRRESDSLAATLSGPQREAEEARTALFKNLAQSAGKVRRRFELWVPRYNDQLEQAHELLEQTRKAAARRVEVARQRLAYIAGRRAEMVALAERLRGAIDRLELQKQRKTKLWLRQVQPFEGDLTGAWDTLGARVSVAGDAVLSSRPRLLWWIGAFGVCTVLALFLQRRFRVLRRDLVG